MTAKAMSIEPDIAYEPVGIESKGKKAHSCCGCCCDMRSAVIIVDILLLIYLVPTILGVELDIKKKMYQRYFNVREEAAEVDVDHHDDQVTMVLADILFNLLAVWCVGLSLYGAITYNKFLVAVNAVFLFVLMPLGGWVTIVVFGLVFYPHACLIFYIHTGVITKENYDNEKKCCCCA